MSNRVVLFNQTLIVYNLMAVVFIVYLPFLAWSMFSIPPFLHLYF